MYTVRQQAKENVKLTHLSLDIMVAICQTMKCIFMNEKFCTLIRFSLKFVPKRPMDNNPAMVEMMAWRRICDKSLSEPVLTRFSDTYMRY